MTLYDFKNKRWNQKIIKNELAVLKNGPNNLEMKISYYYI